MNDECFKKEQKKFYYNIVQIETEELHFANFPLLYQFDIHYENVRANVISPNYKIKQAKYQQIKEYVT